MNHTVKAVSLAEGPAISPKNEARHALETITLL